MFISVYKENATSFYVGLGSADEYGYIDIQEEREFDCEYDALEYACELRRETGLEIEYN